MDNTESRVKDDPRIASRPGMREWRILAVVLAEQVGELAGILPARQRRVERVGTEDQVGLARFADVFLGHAEPGGQFAVGGGMAELLE